MYYICDCISQRSIIPLGLYTCLSRTACRASIYIDCDCQKVDIELYLVSNMNQKKNSMEPVWYKIYGHDNAIQPKYDANICL